MRQNAPLAAHSQSTSCAGRPSALQHAHQSSHDRQTPGSWRQHRACESSAAVQRDGRGRPSLLRTGFLGTLTKPRISGAPAAELSGSAPMQRLDKRHSSCDLPRPHRVCPGWCCCSRLSSRLRRGGHGVQIFCVHCPAGRPWLRPGRRSVPGCVIRPTVCTGCALRRALLRVPPALGWSPALPCVGPPLLALQRRLGQSVL